MSAQRLDVVNVKFFNDLGGEVFQVHAGQLGIAVAIARGVDVRPKRVRGHSDAIARRGWEINVRLGVGKGGVTDSGKNTARSEGRSVGNEPTSRDQAHG